MTILIQIGLALLAGVLMFGPSAALVWRNRRHEPTEHRGER
jgi:hypothetical protein